MMAFDGTLKFDTALDESGFQSGVDELGGLAQKGLDAVKGLAEQAISGVITLGKNAITSGQSFEKSMSQVMATMGITKDTIQDGTNSYELLKKAAADAGKRTAFSATQAGEALNNLALAGYDAGKATDVLETVLNLASAGGMELSYATSLATNSMAALGIEASKENLTDFGDKMAKTASKANTSVSELGEAILTIGGTAQELKGGTTELDALFGVMANRGITAQKAGTHLRNAILSLVAPTDTAAAKLEELGVSATDSEDKLRPINEIMSDLAAAGASTADLNTIFNKTDLATIQALMAGCGEEYSNLVNEIENSGGAMQNMADTMLDNLEGDKTILQSATEGFYNVIYDSMNSGLRELVQLATGYVSELTEAFENGGFNELAKRTGDILSDAVTKISGYLPKIVEIGSSMVTSLLKGLSENAGNIATTGIQIALKLIKGIGHILAEIPNFVTSLVQALADGVSQNYSKISVTAETILNSLTNSMAENIEPLVNAGVQIVGDIASFIVDNLEIIIEAGLQLIQALCDALLNGENLEKLLDAGIQILWAVTNAIIDNLDTIIDIAIRIIEFLATELLKPDNLEKLLSAGGEILEKLMNAIVENLDPLLLACENIIDTLADTLITPENMEKLLVTGGELLGKIVEGLWEITGHLLGWGWEVAEDLDDALFGSDAPDWESLGWQIVEGILSGMTGTDFKIADWLDDFGDNWVTGIKDVFGIHSPSKVMKDEVGEYLALGIGEGFTECMNTVTQQATEALENMTANFPKYGEQSSKQFLDNLSGNLKQVPDDVSKFLNSALDFAEKWGISISEDGKISAKQFLDNIDNFMKQLPDLVTNVCNDALEKVTDWGNLLHENGLTLAKSFVNGIIDIVDTLPEKMLDVGRNLIEGFWNGVTNAGDWLKNQISDFANNIVDNFKNAFGIQSPSKVMRDAVGRYLAEGIGVGFNAHLPEVENDAVKAFSGLRLPEIPVDFSENLESPKIEMESPKMPEIPTIPLNVGNIPEISDISVNVDDVPKLPDLGLNIPDIPEIQVNIDDVPDLPELGLQLPDVPEMQVSVAEIPDIADISVNIDDVPKLPDLGLQLSDVPNIPEMNISVPELEIPDIADISVNIDDVPELPELGLQLPDIPELNLNAPELEVPDISANVEDVPELSVKFSDMQNSLRIDEEALQAFRTQTFNPVNFVQSSPTSSIINNYYQQTTNNTTTNNQKNSQQGDIIIPVSIGGQEIETVIISALQLANMRSGGDVV